MPEDTMLNEAIEALQKGDQTRAKDLLTRLLKVDQENATYWVWLSAAVETQKEKIYCLQTAYKLDPENAAAKRGLILFGALKADDNIKPFHIDHEPLWKQRFREAEEVKQKGLKAALGNPATRLIMVASLVVIVMIVVWTGSKTPLAAVKRPTRTPGPSPTYTLTPTAMNAGLLIEQTATFTGPTPLWMLLKETYTPTPLYVVTQHPITSSDAFTAGIRYFKQGNWKDAINLMEQVTALEKGSGADAWYYIGEANRLNGNNLEAEKAFAEAITINPNFGVAYLGRAIVSLLLDPKAKIKQDLDDAIKYDPSYSPAYVERAVYFLLIDEIEAARADIEKAILLDSGSTMAYTVQAELEMKLKNFPAALSSAQKANELDVTNLAAYLVLGQAYLANDLNEEAVRALEIYNIYHPADHIAMTSLATGYNAVGDFQEAIKLLDGVIAKKINRPEAYYQRGMAYLGLEDLKKAVTNFQLALDYDPKDFDASISLAQTYIKMGFAGDAYVEIKNRAAKLALTDGQLAQLYYWEATALDELGNASAVTYWQELLDLPAEVMPAEWRTLAMEKIAARYTATPTLTFSPTPTKSSTPTPGASRTP
jgi:tetratricopeptide (TPR) repeat protein